MIDTWLRNPRPNAPCAIVAEVAQAHDGSLGMAHAFIDAIASCGADAVKFQTHIANAESTADEPWRTRFNSQDQTRLDYWRRMEFSEAQWMELKAHASDKGLAFLSSPFSLEAVELLQRVGVVAWKVASGETNNHALLDAIAVTGHPNHPLDRHEHAQRDRRCRGPGARARGAAGHPAMHLRLPLSARAGRVESDRRVFANATTAPLVCRITRPPSTLGWLAAAHGIEVLEVHLTLSRDMFGPDVPASVTPAELRQLVDGIRFIETMRAHPLDKQKISAPIQTLRNIFNKSVVAVDDLAVGTVLERRHLAAKKPGDGIPANELPALVGRRLKRAVRCDQRLSLDDLE